MCLNVTCFCLDMDGVYVVIEKHYIYWEHKSVFTAFYKTLETGFGEYGGWGGTSQLSDSKQVTTGAATCG